MWTQVDAPAKETACQGVAQSRWGVFHRTSFPSGGQQEVVSAADHGLREKYRFAEDRGMKMEISNPLDPAKSSEQAARQWAGLQEVEV